MTDPAPPAEIADARGEFADPRPEFADPTRRPLRIGLLGAARITASALVEPARVTGDRLVAVAARDPERARAFAAQHGVERALASYADVIADPEVEIVYNPLANSLHGPCNLAAVRSGKHVLSEKPFAGNAAGARLVRDAAVAAGVTVLEAFHYVHHPVLRRMQTLLDSGELGKLHRVESRFTMPAPPDGDPRWSWDLAGGALMDLGCYALHVQRMVAGGAPRVVSAVGEERAGVQRRRGRGAGRAVRVRRLADLVEPGRARRGVDRGKAGAAAGPAPRRGPDQRDVRARRRRRGRRGVDRSRPGAGDAGGRGRRGARQRRVPAGGADALRRAGGPAELEQATRWLDDARRLNRHAPQVDRALEQAEESRRLNVRALGTPKVGRTLREGLDLLEYCSVAVRTLFRAVLDATRERTGLDADPGYADEVRVAVAGLLADLAGSVRATPRPVRAEHRLAAQAMGRLRSTTRHLTGRVELVKHPRRPAVPTAASSGHDPV